MQLLMFHCFAAGFGQNIHILNSFKKKTLIRPVIIQYNGAVQSTNISPNINKTRNDIYKKIRNP